MKELKFRKILGYIINLRSRNVTLGKIGKKMTAGVPQGSVLDPALWNILYDGIFILVHPASAQIIRSADEKKKINFSIHFVD